MTALIAIIIYSLLLSCKAQTLPMPSAPTNQVSLFGYRTQSVKLTWDPSPSPNVNKYVVFCATNAVFICTNCTTFDYITISNLPMSRLNFFIAAINSNGIQSALSSPYSFSGWRRAASFVLAHSGDLQSWTNFLSIPCTNSEGFYRMGFSYTNIAMP
jgi:hypothetical protein